MLSNSRAFDVPASVCMVPLVLLVGFILFYCDVCDQVFAAGPRSGNDNPFAVGSLQHLDVVQESPVKRNQRVVGRSTEW